VSELSKFSADLQPFDAPAHQDPQVAALLETVKLQENATGNDCVSRSLAPSSYLLLASGRLERRGSLHVVGTAADGSGLGINDRAVHFASASLGGHSKRAMDIAVSLTALVLLSPLLLMVALLIRVTMGGPVIFSHRRLGLHGRPFDCLKFRSMVSNADAALRLYLVNNPAANEEWKTSQKLRRDPRITILGRILRRSSIDELPQLFNVLMGQMSCVGPRPIVDDEIGRYGPYWTEYVKTRPGMTGSWQVSGRNRLTYEKRVALDRHYVRRWSLLGDVWILVRTIPAVMRANETA
jgi:exopolysaccharide production protein ExoY